MQTELLYLRKIALRDIGTCDSCGEAETIEHYLVKCSQNEIAAAVKKICDERRISFTLPMVLEAISRLAHRQ